MPVTAPPLAGRYTLRRLDLDDTEAVVAVELAAFDDLVARLSMPPWSRTEVGERKRRLAVTNRHVIDTDPEGCWCAVIDDAVVGVVRAIRRNTLWGLGMLAVSPAHQGSGIGRSLLDQALTYASGCAGGLISSSPDPHALRAYMTAGFALHPCASAEGRVERGRIPVGLDVRDDLEPDLDLVDDVDQHVRGGASHRPDIAAMIDSGGRFLKADGRTGRGYAIVDNGPRLLAATSPEVAQRLLWSAIAHTAADAECTIHSLDGQQQWALDVVMRARLPVIPYVHGLMVRGDPGRLTPYLASGSFL